MSHLSTVLCDRCRGAYPQPLYTETEVRERERAAATEMFDRFWDKAALYGIPAGQYTPASLLDAVERAARLAALSELTPADAQAALEAERERVRREARLKEAKWWEKYAGHELTYGDHVESLCEVCQRLRALKRPEAQDGK